MPDEPASLVDRFLADHPGRGRLVAEVEGYHIWRLDIPLDEFLSTPDVPLPGGGESAIVAR
jgi:hypothetical protein